MCSWLMVPKHLPQILSSMKHEKITQQITRNSASILGHHPASPMKLWHLLSSVSSRFGYQAIFRYTDGSRSFSLWRDHGRNGFGRRDSEWCGGACWRCPLSRFTGCATWDALLGTQRSIQIMQQSTNIILRDAWGFIYHKDFYYPNMTASDQEYHQGHLGAQHCVHIASIANWSFTCVDHCIETIRISLMCTGDISLYTFHWENDHQEKPTTRSNSERYCANWEKLQAWSLQRTVGMNPLLRRRRRQSTEEVWWARFGFPRIFKAQYAITCHGSNFRLICFWAFGWICWVYILV